MSQAVQAIRNVAFNAVGRATDLSIALLLTPYLIRSLGAGWNGVWTLVMSLAGYYALMDMGLRNAGIKYLAQHDALSDLPAQQRLLGTLRLAYAAIAGCVLLAAGTIAVIFPWVATVAADDVGTIRTVILTTGLNMALTLACQVHATVLSARKRFDLLNVCGVSATLANALGMFLAVRSGAGIVGMGYVLLTVNLASQAGQYLLARRILGPLSLDGKGFDPVVLREILRFSSLDFFVTVSKNLTTQAGILISACMLGPAAVTFYDLANGISHRVRRLAKEVLSVAMPLASTLHAAGKRDELAELLVLLCRGLTALGLLGTILCVVFGYELIAFWIKPEYAAPVYPLLCLLMAARGLGMAGAGIHHVLIGMGKMGFLTRLSVVESVLLIGLGVLGTWQFGLIGLAASVLITQIAVAGIGLSGFAAAEIGLPAWRLFRESTLPALLANLPALGLAWLLHAVYPAAGLFGLLLRIGSVGLLGCVCIFCWCSDKRLRRKTYEAVLPQRLRTRLPALGFRFAPNGSTVAPGR